MYTITEIYFKMKALLASLLLMILKIDPRPHFLWWTPGHNDCVWTLVHLHYTSQFHTFQGNHQSLQWNVCAAHVNNVSSNLVECIDFSDLSGATVGWSRLFVRFRKISQVMMKCMAPPSFTSSRFTLWHYDRPTTQLSRFTLWHNGCRAKQHGLMHVPGVARNFQRKI